MRIRQHVNPLDRKFQQLIAMPDWQEIYSQSNHSLHLDIGCARGKFLLEMAQQYPEQNFLGVEIRQQLVTAANETRDELGLTNLHYLFANMNSAAEILLKSLPKGVLQTISVQFPDPWFKNRHHKRRVVQPKLVEILVEYLAESGKIFLQSDIESVAVEMRDRFAVKSLLTKQHQSMWLKTNPFNLPTEREISVQKRNLPVYRVLFVKNNIE